MLVMTTPESRPSSQCKGYLEWRDFEKVEIYILVGTTVEFGGIDGVMSESISVRRLDKGFECAWMKTSGSKYNFLRSGVANEMRIILVLEI